MIVVSAALLWIVDELLSGMPAARHRWWCWCKSCSKKVAK